jgi:transposase
MVGRPSKYPAEFRREAIELVRSSGRSRVEIARSLGVSDSTLANWMNADTKRRVDDADPEALSESERVELRRLRRENAQLQMDMEILRKAAAYFARETTR